MSVLAHDNHGFSGGNCRAQDFIVNMVWDALVKIIKLLLFAVVDTVQIILADPLRPAFEYEMPIDTSFNRGFGRIADKNKMRVIALRRQSLAQFRHARSQSAGC